MNMAVYIVDDDYSVRTVTRLLLESAGHIVFEFQSADDFLSKYDAEMVGCLILDVRMPGMNGMVLQQELTKKDSLLSIIFITGYGDIKMAVETIQSGAVDFLTKPYREQELLEKVQLALEKQKSLIQQKAQYSKTQAMIGTLTNREKEILERLMDGEASKVIAVELGISERTVDVHRSNILKKFHVKNVVSLVKEIMPAYSLQE